MTNRQPRTNRQKMLDHMAKAEEHNGLVDAAEDRIINQVRRVHRRALARSQNPRYLEVYHAKNDLEGDLLYNQNGKIRDFHVRMATMYGLAALVDKEFLGNMALAQEVLHEINPDLG